MSTLDVAGRRPLCGVCTECAAQAHFSPRDVVPHFADLSRALHSIRGDSHETLHEADRRSVLGFEHGPAGKLGHTSRTRARKATGMCVKLASSQKVLEGIAVADHKLIAKHAEEFAGHQQGGWLEKRRTNTPTSCTAISSAAVRRRSSRMRRRKTSMPPHSPTLTPTLTCVKCHKHVREVWMTP